MPKGEYRFFGIKLNPDKDADMICFLESKKNKQDYIKRLINKDMLHDTYCSGISHAIMEWEERMSK